VSSWVFNHYQIHSALNHDLSTGICLARSLYQDLSFLATRHHTFGRGIDSRHLRHPFIGISLPSLPSYTEGYFSNHITYLPCARKPPVTHAVCLPQSLLLTAFTSLAFTRIPPTINTANTSTDKTTWWGCGKHVPGVMENIPSEQWCTCAPRVEREGHKYPPMGSLASA
jgi:hypothetical protein